MRSLHLQNMKLAIFDFNGTIADTSAGIMDALRYTLQTLGLSIPPDDRLRGFIGGSLLNIYIKEFGFTEKDAREAIKLYRKRYAEVGIHKASLYSGLKNMIERLKNNGI